MQKLFTIIKTGYTSGLYGCTGEQFTAIIIEGERTNAILFKGLYGTEDRIASLLKEKGFIQFSSYANYGKISKKDIRKNTLSEYQAIEEIKNTYSF